MKRINITNSLPYMLGMLTVNTASSMVIKEAIENVVPLKNDASVKEVIMYKVGTFAVAYAVNSVVNGVIQKQIQDIETSINKVIETIEMSKVKVSKM